ncbi:hypothetical protein ACQR24_12260 [Clostridium perfringens]
MRLCNYFQRNKLLFCIFRINLRRISVKYGIQIPYDIKIGPGFNIHHYNEIVIHRNAVIGKRVNIRHNVTIGNVDNFVPSIGMMSI